MQRGGNGGDLMGKRVIRLKCLHQLLENWYVIKSYQFLYQAKKLYTFRWDYIYLFTILVVYNIETFFTYPIEKYNSM